MSYFCRLLICNALLAWALTGCSTPASRSHEHAAAFGKLSPGDQRLVRHGHIRPGMSEEAVYIAWGEPDAKTAGGDGGKSATETWVYRQRVTLQEPINSYAFNGPYHGFGDDYAGQGFLSPYAYGGIGYEGVLRYQPRVRSLDAVRIAEFKGGQVDRYKGADGTWTAPRPAAKRIVHQAVSSLRPPVAIHAGNHHGGKTHVSHAPTHGHGAHHLTAHAHAHSHAPGKAKSKTG